MGLRKEREISYVAPDADPRDAIASQNCLSRSGRPDVADIKPASTLRPITARITLGGLLSPPDSFTVRNF